MTICHAKHNYYSFGLEEEQGVQEALLLSHLSTRQGEILILLESEPLQLFYWERHNNQKEQHLIQLHFYACQLLGNNNKVWVLQTTMHTTQGRGVNDPSFSRTSKDKADEAKCGGETKEGVSFG